MASLTQPLRIGGTSNYIIQYNVTSFATSLSWAPYYIHFKSDVPSNANSIIMLEALGYNYGTSSFERCAWAFYAYNGSVYDKGRETFTGSGLSADGIYKSSDGYACIRAYTSSIYCMGFLVNAYSNPNYCRNISFTAVSINSTSGNYY